MDPPQGAEIANSVGRGKQAFGKSGCSILEMFVMAHRSEKGSKVGFSGWPEFLHPRPLVFKDNFSLRRLANHNCEDEGSVGRAVGHIADRYGARTCYGASLLLCGLCSSPRSLLLAG